MQVQCRDPLAVVVSDPTSERSSWRTGPIERFDGRPAWRKCARSSRSGRCGKLIAMPQDVQLTIAMSLFDLVLNVDLVLNAHPDGN